MAQTAFHGEAVVALVVLGHIPDVLWVHDDCGRATQWALELGVVDLDACTLFGQQLQGAPRATHGPWA